MHTSNNVRGTGLPFQKAMASFVIRHRARQLCVIGIAVFPNKKKKQEEEEEKKETNKQEVLVVLVETTTQERWLENAAYFDLRNIAWTRRLAKKIALQLACDDVIVYARTVVGFVKNAGMPGPKSCLATITFASGSYCSSSNICSTTDSLVSGKMWHTSPGLYRMLDSDMSQTKCLQCVIGMCVCAYMRVCVGVCVCVRVCMWACVFDCQ